MTMTAAQAKEQAAYERRLGFRTPRIHARGVPLPEPPRTRRSSVVPYDAGRAIAVTNPNPA
jgi:hypothetical protein